MTADQPGKAAAFDPDQYRMSIGEHLEELRHRLILSLVGFSIALVVFLVIGRDVTFQFFCEPLLKILRERNLNTVMFYQDVSEPFMIYIKISLICAAAVSSPWLLYQLWKFIAAGLYPHERRWVMKFLPLSIALLIGGMVFVYFLVLPWTVSFFIEFASDIPLPAEFRPATMPAEEMAKYPRPNRVTALPFDPPDAQDFDLWFNTNDNRLKMFLDGRVKVILFGPENMVAPMITLPRYISLVLALLLTFGLCFQLPLVVLGLQRVGIVTLEALKSARRYVYFLMAIAAAIITPGDVIVVTIALVFPLILLYEFGIWLAHLSPAKKIESKP